MRMTSRRVSASQKRIASSPVSTSPRWTIQAVRHIPWVAMMRSPGGAVRIPSSNPSAAWACVSHPVCRSSSRPTGRRSSPTGNKPDFVVAIAVDECHDKVLVAWLCGKQLPVGLQGEGATRGPADRGEGPRVVADPARPRRSRLGRTLKQCGKRSWRTLTPAAPTMAAPKPSTG